MQSCFNDHSDRLWRAFSAVNTTSLWARSGAGMRSVSSKKRFAKATSRRMNRPIAPSLITSVPSPFFEAIGERDNRNRR